MQMRRVEYFIDKHRVVQGDAKMVQSYLSNLINWTGPLVLFHPVCSLIFEYNLNFSC